VPEKRAVVTLRRIMLGDTRGDGDGDAMVATLVDVVRDLTATYGTVTPDDLPDRINKASDVNHD
jgi:hypothetical protein